MQQLKGKNEICIDSKQFMENFCNSLLNGDLERVFIHPWKYYSSCLNLFFFSGGANSHTSKPFETSWVDQVWCQGHRLKGPENQPWLLPQLNSSLEYSSTFVFLTVLSQVSQSRESSLLSSSPVAAADPVQPADKSVKKRSSSKVSKFKCYLKFILDWFLGS